MLAVLLPALPLLASCQTAEPLGRVVTPVQVLPTDPPLNPDPKHVIRLYGRAPASLDFRFRVVFTTTNQEGDCWNHAGFWEGGGALGWAYEFHPVRNGDEWEADFVVDRYLPGECGWVNRASVEIRVQPANPEPGAVYPGGARAIIGDGRDLEGEPRCGPRNPRCSDERLRLLINSDESIPVQVRCKRVAEDVRIGDASFMCNDMIRYKSSHLIQENTARVRIDVYDLGYGKPGVP